MLHSIFDMNLLFLFQVTGSNKGVGFEIVKALCHKVGKDDTVYLTARNELPGKEAVASLKRQGLKTKFHQLDIDNLSHIKAFARFIKDKHGGLDVLVNNAEVTFKVS